jgi:hypothetical protein
MIKEAGKALPVGISSRVIGFPRQGINCAICHTSTFRESVHSVREIVAAGPSASFDSQSYLRFLFAAAQDSRFTADNILPVILKHHDLGVVDKLLYRYVLVPQARNGILEQAKLYAWMQSRPDWGPGRIDPFNPVKFNMLSLDDDGTVGNSDMMPLWNEKNHGGFFYHWDGLERSLTETVIEGALGDGASLKAVNLPNLKRMEGFIRAAQPDSYPFPINQDQAAAGAALFKDSCAQCHAPGGRRTGTVIPIDEIRTDPERLKMWTDAAVQSYSSYANNYPFDFTQLQKTNGYLAVGLEGLWLRGPYLHNGSVPSLRDLLAPAESRPKTFYRGYDVVNPVDVGFDSTSEEAVKQGWLYDTSVRANGNQGHEYGTELSATEREALLEYLKTL